jgi:hypothetical protein
MPEHNLQRRTLLDPSVASLLDDMEGHRAEAQLPRKVREKKARERAKIQARRAHRATFDLPPALRQQVMNLAEEQRVPASQLVTLALLRFFEEYNTGKIDLIQYKRPSRSPKYDWNLELPVEAIPTTKKRKAN